MTETQIIRLAKYYFGKNRTHKKDLVLTYEFNGKKYRQWKKEIKQIIPNPNVIRYKLFDDVILWIKDNQEAEIDWKWIGDLSWTIEIVLNPNVNKGYDWDKNLALHCNGTARILKLFISDVIPCYTYDCYFMTYSKTENYYEFGPIINLTREEKNILKKVTNFLKVKGFQFVDSGFCSKKFKDLYSDTNSDGNSTLFDVLFSDTEFYTTEIKRFCGKTIIEKNGTEFRWTELYDANRTLKERTESRWTSGKDYYKIVLDNKGQITEVEVERKKIENKKFQRFKLDIIDTFRKQKLLANKRKTAANKRFGNIGA